VHTDFHVSLVWIDLAYLLAAVLFILGLKGLAHPRTAVRGNRIGASGMLLAIVATALAIDLDFPLILAALLVGSLAGAVLAVKVRMTAMPQMVALLNGFGGGASVLVAGAALLQNPAPDAVFTVSAAATGLVGAVTFWGSLVAFGKLQEILPGRQILFPGQKALNVLLGAAALGCGAWVALEPQAVAAYWSLVAVSSVLGVTLVLPIGGADMPVVISLLNSYSGIAGATSGFVLSNNALIIAGALVGASGIILTRIMCKAMNRSLLNVLFGVMSAAGGGRAEADKVYGGKVKATTAEEVAMLLGGARRVVFIPGYGLAVSQAQHAVKQLAQLLLDRGVEVEFAIHPVAGRMPGHMNVLLAEADIPYEQVKEMAEINPTFELTDVAIVIGANDVVNPVARTDPGSPIAGMPILEADKARTVVVIKRSLSPGFAGIPNPLFAADNALMLFEDGKKAVQDLIAAVKEAA
jgi:NAD(P) transhydrogenase subunit beta